MKGLLKTAVLLATFCATVMACGGGRECTKICQT